MKKIFQFLVWLVRNFTWGFMLYGIITPAFNKKMKHLSDNLVLVREILIEAPITIGNEAEKMIREVFKTKNVEYLLG